MQPGGLFAGRLTIVAMGMLVVVLGIHLMREFAAILQQLLVAALIGYLILPAHAWLVQRRVPRWMSFVLLVLLFVAASYGLGQVVYHSVADLTGRLPQYQSNLSLLMRRAADRIPGLDRDLLQQLIVGQSTSMETSIGMLRSALGTFFNFFTQITIVVIYLVFLLAEQASFTRRIALAFDGVRAGRIMTVVGNINRSIHQYLLVKTLMSLITAVLTFGVLVLLDVNYAFLWAITAFLLNYIPYLGSVVATILPVLMSLLESPSPWRALFVLCVLGVIQNGIGYFVEPRIAGNRLNLSPLVILLALAFGGAIWGIVGMILAVPLAVVIKAILENIDETRPLAVMMSHI